MKYEEINCYASRVMLIKLVVNLVLQTFVYIKRNINVVLKIDIIIFIPKIYLTTQL